MRPLTKTEFAKERNLSRARIYQLIADGRVSVIIGGEHEGKIDADEAHAKLGELLDQTKGIRRDGNITSSSPPADQPGGKAGQLDDLPPVDENAKDSDRAGGTTKNDTDYWAHKAKREKFEAELAEMKYLQTAGALVHAAGVRREAMETARSVRNAMLAIPDRIAPVLDPANPVRAHKLLTGEIQKVLRELSLGMEERAAAPAGAAAPA